jgi:hypothetical protein
MLVGLGKKVKEIKKQQAAADTQKSNTQAGKRLDFQLCALLVVAGLGRGFGTTTRCTG